MTKLEINTVPPFYKGYATLVEGFDVIEAMQHSAKAMQETILSIPEELGEYRYETGKWSIKELLCHIMDAERIFAYRALRISRNDKTPLSGFDEQLYAPEANAHQRTLKEISEELKRLRDTSIDLYRSFTPDMLQRTGSANNTEISVVNIGYIIAGHESH